MKTSGVLVELIANQSKSMSNQHGLTIRRILTRLEREKHHFTNNLHSFINWSYALLWVTLLKKPEKA